MGVFDGDGKARNNTTLKRGSGWQCQPPQFDYHLKQHNSQTSAALTPVLALFDYHLKQHNSQTSNRESATTKRRVVLEVTHIFFEFMGMFKRQFAQIIVEKRVDLLFKLLFTGA